MRRFELHLELGVLHSIRQLLKLDSPPPPPGTHAAPDAQRYSTEHNSRQEHSHRYTDTQDQGPVYDYRDKVKFD